MLATTGPSEVLPYLPRKPSPLSPRSANVFAAIPSFQPIFFSMVDSENTFTPQQKPSAYSQRQIKPIPLTSRTRDQQRERRRDMFLRRVEQTRDDKRWEGRSDQIVRSNYFAERHRWEQEQARMAPDTPFDSASEMDEEPSSLQPQSPYQVDPNHLMLEPSIEEVEEMQRHEQLELEELLALAESNHQMPDADQTDQPQAQEPQTSDYEDEEYDAVFMEFISDDYNPADIIPKDHDMDLS